MSASSIIRTVLEHPLARGLDLDSAEATAVHQRLLREKPFLRRLYAAFYAEFVRGAAGAPPEGLLLEIGAGAGFLDELIDGLRTLDLRPGARVDLCASALDLPLAAGSVSTMFMLDVLHHLPDIERYFSEAQRVLAPGGRVVMIEPTDSPLARLVYKHLHHEPFDETQQDWTLEMGGPMTSSNQALPWIVFERDRARFESLFPGLRIVEVRRHTILLFLLSGGLSMRQLAPSSAFGLLHGLESALLRFCDRQLATMMTVVVEKRSGG